MEQAEKEARLTSGQASVIVESADRLGPHVEFLPGVKA